MGLDWIFYSLIIGCDICTAIIVHLCILDSVQCNSKQVNARQCRSNQVGAGWRRSMQVNTD